MKLKHINWLNPGTINYVPFNHNWRYVARAVKNTESAFFQDLEDSGLDRSDFHGKKIILDYRGEGYGDDDARPLVEYLTSSLQIQDLMVVFTACEDIENLPYYAVSMPTWMTIHCNWFDHIKSLTYNDTIDRKFLCLMRRTNPVRATVAKNLVELGNSVRMSFGCQSNYSVQQYQHIFPRIKLPITIDGIINRDETSISEHDQSNPVFHSCLFNIIVETSVQNLKNSYSTRFITEKTFKAFALRQIPIWVAVPGLVAEVRKLGFDMFDDIIDHGYDSIPDENLRVKSVIEQIKKLNQYLPLENCQLLRKENRYRLDKNFELVQHYCDQAHPLHIKIVHDFENRIR
jgi:hypothetical protein